MTNGQVNVVSAMPMAPMTVQGQSAPAAETDAVSQGRGVFSGLLSGIQSREDAAAATDSGKAEQAGLKTGKEPAEPEVAAMGPLVDLLALIQAAPQNNPVLSPAAQQSEETVKKEIPMDRPMVGSVSMPAVSQMELAAQIHSGRMPDVNIPAQSIVDGPQKAAAVSEVLSAGIVSLPVERAVEGAEPLQTVSSVAELTASSSVVQLKAGERQPINSSALFAEVASESVPVPSVGGQPVKAVEGKAASSDGMNSVGKLTVLTAGDKFEAAEAVKPAFFASQHEKVQVVVTNAAPVPEAPAPSPVILPVKEAPVAAADGSAAKFETADHDVHGALSGKTALVSSTVQSDISPSRQSVPDSVSPEADVEIQLSQPRPITARAAAAPALAGNRSVILEQDVHVSRQRTDSEERHGVVKELAISQQAVALPEELAKESDLSAGEDDIRKQFEEMVSSQHLRGQVKAEHQKAASFSTRQIPAEPVHENVSEQVMHQVKERLAQHDVKQGNQQITLTLSPDSLGEVKMNLNLQGQKLSVEIVTENKAVRDSIAQHADSLKDSLGRQNITMESFDVTTGGKGSGNQSQNQNAWRELAKQQQQQQFWTSTRSYQTVQADLPSGAAAYMKQQGQSMLDIHY